MLILLSSIALLWGSAVLPTADPARAAVEIVGDDEQDAFVGTGALLLPASIDEQTRREVAACPDCRWRLSSPCVDTELGNAFDGQQACERAPDTCRAGELRRSWFDDGSGVWRNLGLVCVRDRVHTVATMGREVRSTLRESLPEPEVQTLPATGVVTQLPTYLSCGADVGPVELSEVLGGHRVRMSARPTWQWDFGDGTSATTEVPGAPVRGGPVAHVYRQPGSREVRCRVVWEAEFRVDGIGPFPVTQPVRQQAGRAVEVGEGRALLAP